MRLLGVMLIGVLVRGVLVPEVVGRCAADTCLYWLRVTGCATRCARATRMFRGEGLCGSYEDILFKLGRRARITVHLILKEVRASRVAKWYTRKYRF